MSREYKYLYGPVPSRRLGLSLGVDIIPLKVCTLDCIYCQLGRSSNKTVKRKEYVLVEHVLSELTERIAEGLNADYITIAGSGEPTLNSQLGKLLDSIREITNVPLAIITNGTLFYREDVRVDCAKADVVLPSLDAGDDETFREINRPHTDISIEKLVSGLEAFRTEFTGEIWLEVFLVKGVNTDNRQIEAIKGLIKRISPDKVHLNTAVRPTTESGLPKITPQELQAIAAQIGDSCEVIADFPAIDLAKEGRTTAEDAFSMLKRRPCSVADVSAGLSIRPELAAKYLRLLQQQGRIESYQQNATLFFRAV
ncbi:MAG: radical SAM protein [Planctomycetota bacterium]|jgi:wyosine [tRNA(Phe)-imidazoG37] synthetase (radical SAM superfamily)